ncbi:golgin subfamily A member 6-like protein 22 isoform X1 [Cinnamomum micranthum f. kanehirae]|uniref:Golgin subfamily A member 6-like protein 22 isoform X1 n=1 Tax=Cinnamomum micranthum f. kanehirae TaxID=337451 RepID=A0A443NP44_9MAGN|nr:golgin subfamily A member 6-like protein 22 isoform X1 [Cinnamomum micranthum f. kanehirae]
MDEKEILVSSGVATKEIVDSVYPMYFGASCAFAALQLLSTARGPMILCGEWSAIADRMLQGSAQLLGLLVWKAQGGEAMEGKVELLNKLKKAESEVALLKRMRTEDGKANEKVISIIATKEQSWTSERKRLRQHIQALSNDLRAFEAEKEEIMFNFNKEIGEKERLMQLKDEDLEEEICKRKELEERLRMAESVAEELRETAKKEAQDHSSELWKHKTAFIELVSNQRQLEAEMGRAIRQVEATKQELNVTLKQREESIVIIQKLSLEIINLKKDAEQKDKILSAMLRKSKVDMDEKQTLLKEVKLSKARRKQAELETERWRVRCELRPDKHLSSNLSNRPDSRSDMFLESKRLASVAVASSHRWTELKASKNGVNNRTFVFDYLEAGQRKELESISKRMSYATDGHFGQYSPGENVEHILCQLLFHVYLNFFFFSCFKGITTNAKQSDDCITLETEKYITILEQRHYEEIDAFAEQMRLKDEKLESFRWQLLSMELESKQLQSHIEGLDDNVSHFKEEIMKLEVLLSERDKELKSLKKKFSDFSLQSLHCKRRNSSDNTKHPEINPDATRSEAKIIKRKVRENEQYQEVGEVGISGEVETDIQESDAVVRIQEQSKKELERVENSFEDQWQGVGVAVRAPADEIEVIEVCINQDHARENHLNNNCPEHETANKLPSVENSLVKMDSTCKMDLHALGVSYKIKRLKQQLFMVENLAAAQALKKTTGKSNATGTLEICERRKTDEHGHQSKGFLIIMSLLNKHLKRYQNLEEKTNDLCKRMDEKDLVANSSRQHSSTTRMKEQTGALERFLEEAFQLQRYMVAAGQKLMEIQSRIACSFAVTAEGMDKSAGINMRQVEDHIRTLFREIQRGLEIRIARIIGDIEGTLACEGIMNIRN